MKFILLSLLFFIPCLSMNAQSKASQINKSDFNKLEKEIHCLCSELNQANSDSIPQKELRLINATLSETNMQIESIGTKIDSLNKSSQQPEWWGFYPNLWAESGGSFIGVLGALFVFYLTIVWERCKEKRRKREEHNDNNFYLSSLISRTLNKVKSQSESIKEHYEEIRKKPSEFQLMSFTPMHDLKRLGLLLEQDKYYHSFLEPNKTQEDVKKFKAITASVDYLLDITNQITGEVLPKAQQFDFERKKKYESLLDEGMDFAAEIAKQNEVDKPEFSKMVFEHIRNFHQYVAGTNDLNAAQEKYVNPLKEDLIKDYLGLPIARKILENLRKLTYLYSEIIAQNKHHADIIESDYDMIVKAIASLEENAKEIIDRNAI